MPKLGGILESALYVEDMARASEFYHRVLGLEVIDSSDRLIALGVAGRQVLLLFKKGGSASLPRTPHDGSGHLHLAFAVSAPELATWRNTLEQENVPIEEERDWDRGGKSLYFRDPDGHLLEFATPGVWSIY
jgi:catechol 2,3-dioxygenase-like lactoylglutathione lyase family enzyme